MFKSNCFLTLITCIVILTVSTSCTHEEKKVRLSFITSDTTLRKIEVKQPHMLNLSDSLLAELQFDSAGRAFVEFDMTHPSFAYFENGGQYVHLYLEPGYDLKINLSPGGREIFSGQGAEAANYVSETFAIYKTFEFRNGEIYWQQSLTDFAGWVDSLQKTLDTYHTTYSDSVDLPEHTARILRLNNKMLQIGMKQNYLYGLIDQLKLQEVPQQLKNIISEIPFDSEILRYRMFSYGSALHFHMDLDIYQAIRKRHKDDLEAPEWLPLLIYDSLKANEEYPAGMKEFLIAKTIDYHLAAMGMTPVTDSLINDFKGTYPHSVYVPAIQKCVDKWLAISPGKPAPDIKGTTLDGHPLSLSDLQGNIVYIDVWATWCAPCREELPYSKKIQKQFEGNDNVVFLYLSVDNDTEAWKKMVLGDKDFKGTHMVQQDGEVFSAYAIRGIPRYILVDQEGKIVDADADRPSSGLVEGQIRELLEKKEI